jgi:hypothetical protein
MLEERVIEWTRDWKTILDDLGLLRMLHEQAILAPSLDAFERVLAEHDSDGGSERN